MTKAINNHENICMKCLGKFNELCIYYLPERGYGSIFDGMTTKLQLCNSCNYPELEQWFNEKPIMKDFSEEYSHEEDISDLVDTLPLEGQELFRNAFVGGWMGHKIDSQDWIDIELNIAPDETYKKYGYYSPSEIKAYKKRFPVCKHPINVVFNDNSKGCYCPFGAFGDYGQTVGRTMNSSCYECKNYKKRKLENEDSKIVEMDYDTYKNYSKYIKGMQFRDLFE